jgi:hypothetical protein
MNLQWIMILKLNISSKLVGENVWTLDKYFVSAHDNGVSCLSCTSHDNGVSCLSCTSHDNGVSCLSFYSRR